MKILVFGGTTEGRIIAEKLHALGHEVMVSVATDLGAEQLAGNTGIEVHVGRLDVPEIVALLSSFDICIDGTHPYAVAVSANVKKATSEAGVPYYRLLREAGEGTDYEAIERNQKALFFDSAKEIASWCDSNLSPDDKILLTTGSKEAKAYSDCDLSKIYIRILPSEESYELCMKAGFDESHVIQAFGPFSTEANLELINRLGITYVVTKDSGTTGGFPEKLEASKQSKATVLIIRRPKETGYSMDELLEVISEN